MLPFEEALRLVIGAAPRLPNVVIPLEKAAGRVLGETVSADVPLPPFDTTAMDGWAVRTGDLVEPPHVLVVAGTRGAGTAPGEKLGRGTALKVMTGAPVPQGCDAVVPVEEAREAAGGRVELMTTPRSGAHIRRLGEIVEVGRALLAPGRRLAPADLILVAAAGRETLHVVHPARAAILVTGDEVVPAGRRPAPGQIRNTNGPLLAGALDALGCDVVFTDIVKDHEEDLARAIEAALDERPDFLLTSGGVSAGDFDLVGDALQKKGAEVLFHKVSMRPAKPLLVARLGETLVFGLPGNPVSAAVAFDLFVRPALRAASGLSPALPDPVDVELTEPLRNKGPRRAFLPARVIAFEARLRAHPIASKGSHDVASHAEANAYVSLPPESAFSRGDLIPAYLGTRETTIEAF